AGVGGVERDLNPAGVGVPLGAVDGGGQGDRGQRERLDVGREHVGDALGPDGVAEAGGVLRVAAGGPDVLVIDWLVGAGDAERDEGAVVVEERAAVGGGEAA